MKRTHSHGVMSRLRSEDGQALVEFGIIAAFLLLPLIAGIVQFGTGIAYWHDQNRLANQGARFATVNSWPGCPTSATTCTNNDVNCTTPAGRTLQAFLRCEAVNQGLRNSVQILVCTPGPNGAARGEPITVRLTSQWNFAPIVELFTIDLVGEATMRIEVAPSKITPSPAPCP